MINSKKGNAGQGFIEYVLIIGLIPVLLIGVLDVMGVTLRDVYCNVITTLGSDACKGSFFTDSFDSLDEWEIITGKWNINDGKLCNNKGGKIFRDIPQSNDYQINLSGANLTKGSGFGIMFRSTNYEKDNGYIFQYDAGFGKGAMIFRERVNGREFHPSARYRPTGDYDWYNEPHDIKLVIQGDTFTAFVDDQQVLQTQDKTWSEGGFGFRTWNATEVCFDNVSVDPIP